MSCAFSAAVDLDSYLTRQKITDAAFAKTIGRSRSLVTKLRHGIAKPSAEIALKIEIATGREVCLADLVPSLASWAPCLPSPLLPLGVRAALAALGHPELNFISTQFQEA